MNCWTAQDEIQESCESDSGVSMVSATLQIAMEAL
jgi:hypothetical protein